METPSIRQRREDFTPALRFTKATHQDGIYELALDAVQAYNISSMERHIDQLRVWKLQDPLNSTTEYGDQTSVYAIAGKGFVARMPLQRKFKESGLKLDYYFIVSSESGPIGLESWLQNLPQTRFHGRHWPRKL